MVLEYLATNLGHFGGFYVGTSSSTMEYRGTEIHVWFWVPSLNCQLAILCKCVIPNPFRTYDFFGRIHLMQRRVHQTSSMEWPSVTKADPCRPVSGCLYILVTVPLLNSNDIAWFLAWLRFTMFLILFDGRTYRNMSTAWTVNTYTFLRISCWFVCSLVEFHVWICVQCYPPFR